MKITCIDRFLDDESKSVFSLRWKAALLIAFIITPLSILLSFLVKNLIEYRFFQMEQQQAMESLSTFEQTLNLEVERIDRTAGDWAFWDSTYQFASDLNNAYIEENLGYDSFLVLGIDTFLIFDIEGNLEYSRAYDFNLEEIVAVNPAILKSIAYHQSVFDNYSTSNNPKGIFAVGDQVFLFSAKPILRSDQQGPQRHFMVMGRILDQELVSSLREITHLDASVISFNQMNLDDQWRQAKSQLLGGSDHYIVPDGLTLTAYSKMDDFTGAPASIIRIDNYRELLLEAQNINKTFIILFLLFGLILGALIIHSIDTRIISRIKTVNSGLESIRDLGDLSKRIKLPGNDELTILAAGINATLDQLEKSAGELQKQKDKLSYEATHDSLTGFVNRSSFNQELSTILAHSTTPPSSQAAVLFLDLDGFKIINDSFSHQVGDQILIIFGDRIRKCIGDHHTLARLGGDEFAILIHPLESPNEATLVAQKILDQMTIPFEYDQRRIFLSVSIGIAFTESHKKPEDVLRDADLAMYRAKTNGKARYEIYDQEMHSTLLNRLQLDLDLRNGIQNHEFHSVFQPIINLENGQICGIEALVRWKHPVRGIVPPDQFIPVMEENGLILPMTEIVLMNALRNLKLWHEICSPGFFVSVNIPTVLLRDNLFIQLVKNQLNTSGISPANLHLEITESGMIQDYEITSKNIDDLKAIGVHFSIDDFGTGYSSLSYLRRLGAHTLKIDRAFIADLETSSDGRSIVAAIVAIGQKLDMDIVAEGIENQKQLEILKVQKCNKAQGYLFSPPVEAQKITEFLTSRPTFF